MVCSLSPSWLTWTASSPTNRSVRAAYKGTSWTRSAPNRSPPEKRQRDNSQWSSLSKLWHSHRRQWSSHSICLHSYSILWPQPSVVVLHSHRRRWHSHRRHLQRPPSSVSKLFIFFTLAITIVVHSHSAAPPKKVRGPAKEPHGPATEYYLYKFFTKKSSK